MSEKYLEYSQDMSLEKKQEIIRNNYNIARGLNKQMSSLSSKSIPLASHFQEKTSSPKTEAQITEFDEIFSKLYQAVITSDINDLNGTITAIISPDDTNYFKYINMLKLRLYEEMTELSNLAFQSGNIFDPEINEMYTELSDILVAIDELEEEEELLATSQNANNTLIFMTSLNRVIFYENVDKDIPTDMYNQVLELIEGMIKGEFKGLKYLHAKKMFEIRLGEVRITFAKLRNNTFLVLGCFLKKFVSNKNYREMMFRVRDQYLAEKEQYLSQIEDPMFLATQQKYLDDITSLCEAKGRVRQ